MRFDVQKSGISPPQTSPTSTTSSQKNYTIVKQKFRVTTIISAVYIFYCANLPNWASGASRPSVAPYVTATTISKLDAFYERNISKLHRNQSRPNFESNTTIMELQSLKSISLSITGSTTVENFANHKIAFDNVVMFRTPTHSETAKCVQSLKCHYVAPKLALGCCMIWRSKQRRNGDYRQRNTMGELLLKWKIRKKMQNKRYVRTVNVNKFHIESNEGSAEAATTETTANTTVYSALTNVTDLSYDNNTDDVVDDDDYNVLINTSAITQMPSSTITTTLSVTIPTYPVVGENNSSARQIDPTQRAIITHFLNHFKENNVFEMATKLKYNKFSIGVDGDSSGGSVGDKAEKGIGKVSLLGLFELSTRAGIRPEGRSELAAAQLAVRHINERHLLPGYTLELLTNDTKCDPGVGVDRFFHALYTQHTTRLIMLLGSACSEVTESLAKVVPYWNILQVSFGSTSPALSDQREFPLFFRTVAPDSSHNVARIAFIRRFGWDTVTTFSQNEEIHSLAVNDLVTQLEASNISCAATITFAETDFRDQLRMLRDLDTRIIIGSFSHDLAPKIFCEAYKLGMYGADYAWILHETIGRSWWKLATSECHQHEIAEASENVLIVSSHNRIVGGSVSYSGLTNRKFSEELRRLNASRPVSRYAPQTYDAVWAIALALRGAEMGWLNHSIPSTLNNFDYSRYDMSKEFKRQFELLQFLGVSGPVSFKGADRVGTSIFLQIQHGKLQPIALFHPSMVHLDFKCPECRILRWKSGQVPIAKRIFKLRVATIAPVAFYTITSIASVGITLSIAFLAFNLHFRKLKSIKLSSPKLSNITAVGCILVYAAVVLLGLDYSTLPANDKAFPIICTARVYLLSSGFSLAFGSMFAKTYRVHRIFTHSGGGVCKDKMLRDTQLISLVCALLLLDGLVVTLWVVVDPMERHLSNLTLEISSTDRSVVYQPQVEVCRSHHTQSWLGALYAYKGLLLIVGVYMAWETRHVKIPALNDSQYIGMSVYSVVITSAIVVVLANLIAERVTLAFITITALILTSTTATLSLLFLPKINDIWGKGVINDPIIHSMGLKMECNTRRFVTDDRRELQYRVEVQNRVYKKEMAALDAEILKLQKMLDSNSTTSSSDMSLLNSIKHEIAIVNETMASQNQFTEPRTPSIGGGLPLLLLSVLPPVIPRASWPSSDHSIVTPMRRSVTFSSQPHLDNDCCRQSGVARLPAIDLFNLRLTHQQATADASGGLLNRIKGIFGARTPARKDSTISFSDAPSAMIKKRISKLTGIVSCQTTASCNALHTTSTKLSHKTSLVKSGTAINTISSSSGELSYNRVGDMPSISLQLTEYPNTNGVNEHADRIVLTSSEPRVFFQLPDNRRPSICVQNTLRERIKGSPRFPHRIAPTSSLNALIDELDDETDELQFTMKTRSKWKSMEESSFKSTSSSSSSAGRSVASAVLHDQISSTTSEETIVKIPNHNEDDDNISVISVISTNNIPNDDTIEHCDDQN